jgi:hypothetical protein
MKMRNWSVAVALLLLTACSKGPDDVAQTFIQDTAAGRTSEAVENFDPELRQMAGMKLTAGLRSQAEKANRKGGVKELRVVSTEQADDAHATVTTETTFGDGSTLRDVGKLRKVHGRWYVTI